jgi:alanine racemase
MRPGLALYGVAPNARLVSKAALIPVMRFKTRVLLVKSISRGDSVSYNRTFVAKKPTRVAVLAAGYADGLPRHLSNRGACLIRGKRVPLVGNICMDMCMADVTRVPGVKPGDTAVFWGRDGRAVLTVEEQARAAGTIPYELLCGVSQRVERIYT